MASNKDKKKRRKIRISGIAKIMITFAFLGLLYCQLFVNTRNASLIMKIQTLNEEVEKIQKENQSLNFEIQSLENKDRVYEIAQTAQMDQVANNIISVFGE